MRVLVVEDSEKLLKRLSLALRNSGYAVDSTGNGSEGLWMAREIPYDAMVLDIMLPGMDGLSVLKQMRADGLQTPVLMLTVKGEVEDRVTGLRSGADDYLTKPFALEELLARVESLIRRRYAERNPILKIGPLELDTALKTAAHLGKPLLLTPREYKLLELLALRKGEVLSRAEIEQHLYNEETEVFSNVVESTVSSLRKKIDVEGDESVLQTRRGMGYCLRMETEETP